MGFFSKISNIKVPFLGSWKSTSNSGSEHAFIGFPAQPHHQLLPKTCSAPKFWRTRDLVTVTVFTSPRFWTLWPVPTVSLAYALSIKFQGMHMAIIEVTWAGKLCRQNYVWLKRWRNVLLRCPHCFLRRVRVFITSADNNILVQAWRSLSACVFFASSFWIHQSPHFPIGQGLPILLYFCPTRNFFVLTSHPLQLSRKVIITCQNTMPISTSFTTAWLQLLNIRAETTNSKIRIDCSWC